MTTLVQNLAGPPAYLAVGGFALLESAAFVGLVVPGESAMVVGGALAGLGHASLPVMILAAAVGAVLGDLVGYGLGRHLGPALRRSRWGRAVGQARWARADELIARRGPLAVFLGRWVGFLRALVPAVAGAARMPMRRFLPWNALGGTAWASAVLTVGYLAGGSWAAVQARVGAWATIMTALTIGALLVPVLRRARRRPTGPRLDAEGASVLVNAGS